jgi:replicative DNA helicase
MKTMKEMGIEEVIERNERCKTFGFEKKYDRQLKNQKRRGKCKNCFTKRRLAELEKEKMNTLLDEIILNKKNKTTDVVKKKDDDSYNPVEKILIRNIESIKKIAEKEGLDINSLLKKLKDEQ